MINNIAKSSETHFSPTWRLTHKSDSKIIQILSTRSSVPVSTYADDCGIKNI
jgi:hypothetical protein